MFCLLLQNLKISSNELAQLDHLVFRLKYEKQLFEEERTMKAKPIFYLLIFLFLFLFSGSSMAVDKVDEVGPRIMIAEPKAKPLYVNKNGTKYWPCDGYINKKLIPIIHTQLSSMSKNYGVAIPEINPCYYSIGS